MSDEIQKQSRPGRIVSKITKRHTKLNRLGKIRVGMKTQSRSGNKLVPTSLDYFVATGKYAEKFYAAYPDQPNVIGVVFVSDNIEDACNERLELRDNTGSLVATGDGREFKVYDKKIDDYVSYVMDDEDDDTAKYLRLELPKMLSTANFRAKWEVVLTMQFVVPKIKDVFGVWVFETKGKMSSIPNIRDTFDAVKDMAGTVVNIPFDLTVEKVKSQKPGSSRTYPVVNLIPNVSKDRMETIQDFLNQGNSIKEIKRLLDEPTDTTEGQKLIDEKIENTEKAKAKAIESGSQAILFTDNE